MGFNYFLNLKNFSLTHVIHGSIVAGIILMNEAPKYVSESTKKKGICQQKSILNKFSTLFYLSSDII